VVDRPVSPILLLDQNRSRWDQLLIRRGLTALERAESLTAREPGPYVLQAAIAACHARARVAESTDWVRIAGLYEQLAAVEPSSVVELNRAVAVGMAYGPQAGLSLVEQLAIAPSLRNYHLLPGVRGDFLEKLGRFDEARDEFNRAASMTQNERERTLLLERQQWAATFASCDLNGQVHSPVFVAVDRTPQFVAALLQRHGERSRAATRHRRGRLHRHARSFDGEVVGEAAHILDIEAIGAGLESRRGKGDREFLFGGGHRGARRGCL
jgi:hypothetical protein